MELPRVHREGDPRDNPPADVPEALRQRSLRYSVWDASFYASMAGFGEAYFIPLMVAIGASNFYIGVFTAIPYIFIALAQFASLLYVERFMVRKPVFLVGAASQAIFTGFFLLGIIFHSEYVWLYIGLACGYYASIGFTGPAWNSLMGDLTTPATRGHYFGKRNGLSQLTLFLAIFAAGLILQHFDLISKPMIGFAVIFAVAFLSRSSSVYTLTQHYEVPYQKVEGSYFSFSQFIRRSPRSNFARFVFFVALMSFAVQTAAPFFATYMLRDLHFSYIQYTVALGAMVVTQFLAMRRWGPFADSYGNRMVLRITGAVLPVIPILWLFSPNFIYIIIIQVISGLAWAGWTLSSSNFIFDAVSPPKRARCAAYLTFFNSMGVFVGAMTGAYLSRVAPEVIHTGAITVSFLSPLEFLFLLSGLLRFIMVSIFMPTLREVREVQHANLKDMFMRLTSIRPLNGVRYEPYTGVDAGEWEGPME